MFTIVLIAFSLVMSFADGLTTTGIRWSSSRHLMSEESMSLDVLMASNANTTIGKLVKISRNKSKRVTFL